MRVAASWCFIVFCLAQTCLAAGGNDAERMRRSAERANRANVAKGYLNARKSAETAYLNSLSTTIKWLAEIGAKDDATRLLGEISSVNAQHLSLKDLQKIVDGVAQSKSLEDRQRTELESRLKSARKQRAEGLLALAKTCYGAGLLGYAYDLAWDAMKFDPDNGIARSAMAQTKSGNEWLPRFAAVQVQHSAVWLPDIGWVAKGNAERIKAGEWFEDGKWMTMAEANKLHSSLSKPWIIETENFTLKSTATRKQAVQISERLEAIKELCFRQYLEFFMRGSKQRGGQLLFSAPFEKKLAVNYYGKRDDYLTAAQKAGTNQALLTRSAGFYSPAQHESYFYYDPNFGPFQVTIMQHEVTHQLLGENARGGISPTWVAEGMAEVMEYAFAGAGGRLELGRGYDHPDVIKVAAMMKQKKTPPVTTLLSCSHENFHKEPARAGNYAAAGALCRFLLDYKDGIYAADFLEYVHDSYRGRAARLADYIDMNDDVLETVFTSYLAECKKSAEPKFQPVQRSGGAPAEKKNAFEQNEGNAGPGNEGPFKRG